MTESPELKPIAAAAYNRAYELVIDGTPADLAEGLELAAASLHLWRIIGPERRVAIGLWMYSRALQKAGAQTLAIETARECNRLANLDGTDWMIASSLEALTRAHLGLPEFEGLRAQTAAAIDAIEDSKEKEIMAGQFADLREL